jgi:hypothetical protein
MMRYPALALAASLALATAPAQAQSLGQKLRQAVFQMQQRSLLGKLGASRMISNPLKGEVQQTAAALAELGRQADRVQMSGARGQSTASYYRGTTLLGKATLTRANNQTSLTVTTYPGANAESHQEVFTTGRGALKLVAGELAAALSGKKPLQVAIRQIKGELVHGTSTAGRRSTTITDLGRSDLTVTRFRVEQWLTRGLGAPRTSPLPGALPLRDGKAVVGTIEQRESRYVLDAGGQRVPNPDPEAEGRPMRETLRSFRVNYCVGTFGGTYYDPFGTPVVQAVAP